ncbi:Gfo/Idh/MocA family protein [Haloferula sp. A504]|uniref:Gfo/Idh/MocA family protein n=1 Tax=Haloferula sp. A504 TaxID=3373601 RepID=UPI0031BC93FF|nr:Gfo/Idh/MocA family oxidoreductase [Verrucomicrobiaceae bacterium E54]
MIESIPRRNFLRTGLLAGGGTLISNHRAWAQRSSNRKLKVALIGAGGIAKTAYNDCAREQVIAIADVDAKQGEPGFKKFPDAKRYTDFRKLLDAHGKELDAVIVSTPDHTHFAATYDAMQRGIAVHTQKPLTHDLWQARTLRKAYHEFKVPTVMGNQGHTMEGMRYIREWYEAGLAGEIVEVHAWTNRTTKNNTNAERFKDLPGIPVPGHLDWDLWQGPVPEKRLLEGLVPSGWRWWWDYGLGGLGDIGCHTLDIPVYALGLGMPVSVRTDKSIDFSKESGGKTPRPEAMTYIYEFARGGGKPNLKVFWYEGGHLPRLPDSLKGGKMDGSGGCLLVGEKNTIVSPGMRPTSPRMLENWDEIRRNLPAKTLPRAVGGPIKELFAAIRGEIEKPGSDFDYAAPLTEIVILGTIAMRSGKEVRYQPETLTFEDTSLDPYVKAPVRPGWDYGVDLWKD